MNPEFKITFTSKETSEFRIDNKPPGITEAKNISFSEEADFAQKERAGQKVIKLYTEGNTDSIGTITYDYPDEREGADNMIRVRVATVNPDYSGQELGVQLYEQLIALAKSKDMDGIRSDSVVQGGALATWKKLADIGYDIQIHPEVEQQWQDFLKTYSEGKYYKQLLSINNTKDSVFRLIFDKDKNSTGI